MGDAKKMHQLICEDFRLPVHLPLNNTRHKDIFPDSQTVQQHEILKHKAQLLISYLRKFRLTKIDKLRAAQRDFPFIKRNITGDTI